MNWYNYVFIVIFLLFLRPSKTRVSALVLLFAYAAYSNLLLVFEIRGLYRYSATATIDFCAGLFFINILKDKVMAYLSFCAIPIGFIGGLLYWNYYPPIIYGNMCVTIMIIQVAVLFWRANKRGILNIGSCIILFVYGTFNRSSKTRNIKMQTKQRKGQA